ncbi:reverse transcriptase domain-containing protein [Tanacetum coccineum]
MDGTRMMCCKPVKEVRSVEEGRDFYAKKSTNVEDAFQTKNARATYQRLVDKVFESQIRRNMEACVDDMGCLEKKDFMSTRKADRAFEDMKRYIEKLPTLVAPKAEESLIVYLAALRECNAIKAKVLVDFQTETQEEDEETDFQDQEDQKTNTRWRLYIDGASSDDGSGARLMIVSSEGMEFTYALKFKFMATNNEAGYKSVIAGLQIAKEMKIEEIAVYLDSQLVANQVNGSLRSKIPPYKIVFANNEGTTKDLPTF